MKIKLLSLFSAMIIAITVNAQNEIKELKIGDKVPDVFLPYVLNYKTNSAKLSDFKRKLTIIDFWGTGCAGCIASFPEINRLQKEFEGPVQFVFVNESSKDSTLRFFAKTKIKLPNVPFVTGDSILIKYFPHWLVPQDVWIDSQGIVRAITDGYNTTSEHIKQFLNGETPQLSLKKDIDFKTYKAFSDLPMISYPDTNILKQVKYYSYIMHGLDNIGGVGSILRTMGSQKTNKIEFTDAPAKELFITAFSEEGKYDFNPKNTVVLEAKDTLKYVAPSNPNKLDDWSAENLYAYELFVIPSKADQIYKMMQQDLTRFFDATATVEKRKIKCLVMVRTSNADKLKTKGGKPEMNFFKPQLSPVRYFHNLPFKRLSTALFFRLESGGTCQLPFKDETNYIGNIDVEIPADDWMGKDMLEKLRKDLQKYDLDIIEKDMTCNVLVIKDNSK